VVANVCACVVGVVGCRAGAGSSVVLVVLAFRLSSYLTLAARLQSLLD
jgi:hypothetical protein